MGEMPVKGLLPCLRQALDTAAAVTDQATDIAAAKTHEGSRHAAWFLRRKVCMHCRSARVCTGGRACCVPEEQKQWLSRECRDAIACQRLMPSHEP